MNDPAQIVVDLIFGRWRSQILYAGVNLGILNPSPSVFSRL
jgi:hypothetical protein